MNLATLILAFFTLTAFAANSILCRQALMTSSIGPVEFTMIRLGSGIIALLPIVLLRNKWFKPDRRQRPVESTLFDIRQSNIWPALALFGYAIFFSLAYIELDAGVGALILFASVQITMMGVSIVQGSRITLYEWLGLVISFSGLIYLLSPGLTAPPAAGTILMVFSGASWGIYSLLGKNQTEPILATARNFLFCLPGVVFLGLIALGNTLQRGPVTISTDAILLAVVSGAITSGMGYVLWYLTVRRITTTTASICQPAVPVLAALGGVVFLREALSFRLVVSSILIIGGIVVATVTRRVPESWANRSGSKNVIGK